MERLEGQVAIVTGGAGGLGTEICRVLARDGAQVVCLDRREEEARAVAEQLRADGGRVAAVAADISRPEAAAEAVAKIVRDRDRLDILINNAAIDITLP